MPLHEIEDCPEAVTIDLWLFALKMVVDVHNATPGPSGHYPEETFSKQRVGQTGLRNSSPLGTPSLYWIHPPSSHKKPKWQPISRQAIYLGHSPCHVQMVPIVLNLCKGLCFPQYHVVFHDNFTTTSVATTNKLPQNWEQLFTGHRMNCLAGKSFPPDTAPILSHEWQDVPTKRGYR